MLVVLFFLMLFAILGLFLGIIRPTLVIRWGKTEQRTRKRVLLYYGSAIVIFFVGLIISAPELTPEEKTAMAQKREEAQNQKEIRSKAKEEAKAEAEHKAEEEAKVKAGAEAAAARAKAEEEAKRKSVEEAKTKADADAKAFTEQKSSESTLKVMEYDLENNIVIAVASPNHEAVKSAATKILNNKDLHLQKVNKDKLNLLINFYSDEKSAKLASKNDTTDEEDKYVLDHWYAQYSSGNEKVSPVIRIFGLNAQNHTTSSDIIKF